MLKPLLKKDFLEIRKTSKIIVLPLIFIFFGITSPLTTKLLPQILSSMAGEIAIKLPEQHWFDALLQFNKNLNQIGILAMILVFMGAVAEEKSKGTATLVLAKGVKHGNFVASKLIASASLLIGSIAISCAFCWYYTFYLFKEFDIQAALLSISFFAFLSLWLLVMVISFSMLAKTPLAAGGLSLALFIFNSISSIFPTEIGKFLPGKLLSLQSEVLTGIIAFEDVLPPVAVSIIVAVIVYYLCLNRFRCEELA
jgi:ABC-2 type transport system permease protein